MFPQRDRRSPHPVPVPASAPRRTVERWPATLAVGATTALLVAYLVYEPTIYRSVGLLAFATAAYAALALTSPVRWLVACGFAVCAVVALGPHPDGTDLWVYQAYGRTVVEHGENPYVTPPGAFPDDPVLTHVSPLYHETKSGYGPLFVGLAAVVAAATGVREGVVTHTWQAISIAAVAATMFLLRRRAGPDALAVVALSPVIVYEVVHLAHNDGLVGFAVLGGCLLASAGRTTWAALALTAAALIKAPSGVALVVLVVWLLARRQRRAALHAALAALGTATVAVLAAGGPRILRPLLDAGRAVNATSVWNVIRGDAITFVWRPLRGHEQPAGPVLATTVAALTLAVAVTAGWRLRRRPLHEAVAAALLGWFVLSLYPSSWYAAALIPVVALCPHRKRWLSAIWTSCYLLTTQAWLFPVAARFRGDGSLSTLDRLAAPMLGLTTIAGLALLAYHLVEAEPPAARPDDVESVTPPATPHSSTSK